MQENSVILNNLIQVSRNLEILEMVRTYATPDSRKKARSGGKFWLFFSMIRKLFGGALDLASGAICGLLSGTPTLTAPP